jgi:capsular exopolysaccharide synthesis family protein
MELRLILEILWRRKWIIAYIFSAFFFTILIASVLITPWYDATSKVLIRKSSAASSLFSSLGLQSGASTQTTTISDTDREDYLALAAVRPVVENVIKDLNVTRERTRSRIMRAIPFLRPVLKAVGVDITSTMQTMTAEDLTDASILSIIFPRPYVEVTQYEESDILEITATSPDPAQAGDIANAMAEAFIAEELKRVRDDYTGARRFIDENIERARLEYQKALEDQRQYKEAEKTINIDTETSNIIQKVYDLKKNMVDNSLLIFKTKNSIKRIEEDLKRIPKYQKASEQIKENDVIISLKLSMRDLYLDLATARSKYTDEHPAVIEIRNKIESTREMIEREAQKVFGQETLSIDPVYQDLAGKLAGYYADLAGYEGQNREYPKIISGYEDELMKLPKKAYLGTQIQLGVTVTEDIYKTLLTYQYRIGIAESMAISNIYIVEPAIAPDPKDARHRKPDAVMNTIVAVFLGVTFGIGAALVMEYLDDTIKTADDIKAFKTPTFLGNILRLKKTEPKLIDSADPRSHLNEIFRSIRNSIRFASLDKPAGSFVITSSIQGEGKTFFSSNIAIAIANEGKKVLIIDGDLRRPAIHNQFGKSNVKGITNILAGDAEVNDVKIETNVAGLDIITTGPIPPDPARLVESKRMQGLIAEMEGVYDTVIIDAPPLLPSSDAIILGGYAKGILLVMESEKASRTIFGDMLEHIRKANLNLIGVVLNKVRGTRASYYYYYSQYYQ